MYRRSIRRNIETPQIYKIGTSMNCVEDTIDIDDAICGGQNCRCRVCQYQGFLTKRKLYKFDKNSRESADWLLLVLNGLYSKDTLTLQFYVPDIVFIEGETLRVFYSDSKDNRIKKIEGWVPTKSIYQAMVYLKKLYKEMLEEYFQNTMLNNINPEQVNDKYLQQILPSFLNSGQQPEYLQKNKHTFRHYILHKDPSLVIESIDQHRLNQDEPFCSLHYKDGTLELFTKKQFETYTITRFSPNEISYIQGYVKQGTGKANYSSVWTQGQVIQDHQQQLFKMAQKQVLITIGRTYEQISKQYQDRVSQMQKSQPQSYCTYQTYLLLHYLSMVSRVYLQHIRINWLINDLGMFYMINIVQLELAQLPKRLLKFQMPVREDSGLFDCQRFVKQYQSVQGVGANQQQEREVESQKEKEKEKEKEREKQGKYLQTQKTTMAQTISIKASQLQSTKPRVLLSLKNKTILAAIDRLYQKSLDHKQKHRQRQAKSKQEQEHEKQEQEGEDLSKDKSKRQRWNMEDKWNHQDRYQEIKMTALERKRNDRNKSMLEKYAF